jgi:hypothetical protein
MFVEMTVDQLARTMCDSEYRLSNRREFEAMIKDGRMRVRIENIFRILHAEYCGRDTRQQLLNDLIDHQSDIYRLACDFNYMYLPKDFLEIRLRHPVEDWRRSVIVKTPDWVEMENPRSSEVIYLNGSQDQWTALSEMFPSFSYNELRSWHIRISAKKYVERFDYCDRCCRDCSTQTEPQTFL